MTTIWGLGAGHPTTTLVETIASSALVSLSYYVLTQKTEIRMISIITKLLSFYISFFVSMLQIPRSLETT
jgi:hypothetical protein